MKQLEKFSDDFILPVNVSKTKVLLVHSVVSPPIPNLNYKGQKLNYVKSFKYLGIYISTKLGWGTHIHKRLRTIRKIYKGLKIIYLKIPLDLISIRRRIFFSYALPYFYWLFCLWFFFTEIQRRTIEHLLCTGLRIVYPLKGWDDIATMILSREKCLRDYTYIYSYWSRLSEHLEKAPDAVSFQQSWQAYKTATFSNKSWRHSVGFSVNSKFPRRLAERAKHTLSDWKKFEAVHKEPFEYYKRNSLYLSMFIYKHFIYPP